MVESPIWKDTEYRVNDDVFEYYITVDGQVIFNGKAFKRPNATLLVVNINRICQNYLSNELPEEFVNITGQTQYFNSEAVKDFLLYGSNGTLLETYRFSYDWSYDGGVPSPINGHYASGQFIFRTIKNQTNYNNTISINGDSNYCGDYAIYYLDSFGCWQSFLFEGNCRMYDSFTQYEYNKSFNNTTPQFEKGRYISEIETRYELSTGWLNDTEAYNFSRNLVGTNMAYLHNLNDGRIFPIILDETEVEYKKYKNDRHLIEYTIRVKESQNRIRK